MSTQLTKRQHQVPQFYLKLWGDASNKLWQYDLKNLSCKQIGTKKILCGEFYYEEDQENPDNRIENILGEIETECAPVLKGLNDITERYLKYSQVNKLKKELELFLTDQYQQTIKKFAAFQYLRIPGAVEQKEYELQGSLLPQSEIDYGLKPGRFVESGFDYLKDRFMTLIMIVDYSFDELFLTSDWPCFDMKDSDDSPFLGEEIGRSSEVVACMPLIPRLRAIFIPRNFNNNPEISRVPDLIIKYTSGSQVKNQNTLTVHQCIRYVISNKREDSIFNLAEKRKRNKL